MLIGFYYKKPSAAAAAKKAFLVNRIGDFGFALGIFALYMFLKDIVQPGENPLDYAVVFKYVSALTEGQLTTVALLLTCGALGKSAQFPLYVWLPGRDGRPLAGFGLDPRRHDGHRRHLHDRSLRPDLRRLAARA